MKRIVFMMLIAAIGIFSSCSQWYNDDDENNTVFRLENFKETTATGTWRINEFTNSQANVGGYNFEFLDNGALIAESSTTVGSGYWQAWVDEEGDGFVEINFSTVGELQALNGEYCIFSFSGEELFLSRYVNEGFQNLTFTRP